MDEAVALTNGEQNMGRHSDMFGVAEVRLMGCPRKIQQLVTEQASSRHRRLMFDGNDGMFAYDLDSTPNITSVSPNRGSTAGGTKITITGTLLKHPQYHQQRRHLLNGFATQVRIAGKECAVTLITDTAVECTTGYHGVTDEQSLTGHWLVRLGTQLTIRSLASVRGGPAVLVAVDRALRRVTRCTDSSHESRGRFVRGTRGV